MVEVVSQVLQVQSPGAQFLPVDPLEGHDAVQVSTHLWRQRAFCQSGSHGNVNIISDILKSRGEMGNLFGFAALESPLCVTDVQVIWILCVEVSHNVQPSETKRFMFSSSTTGYDQIRQTEERRSLLFTVNSWMFPTGLTDEDPVLHFIGGQRPPLHKRFRTVQSLEASFKALTSAF